MKELSMSCARTLGDHLPGKKRVTNWRIRMNGTYLNFDLYALAQPKNRTDLAALANEINAELDIIDAHLDAAIARCAAEAAVNC